MLISRNVPLFNVETAPVHIRKAFAADAQHAVGKSAIDAEYGPDGKVRNERAKQVAAIRNNEKNKSGEADFDLPTLEKFLLEHPEAAASLTTAAARKVKLSIFQQLAERCDANRGSYLSAATSARVDAETTYSDLLNALREKGLAACLPERLDPDMFLHDKTSQAKALPEDIQSAIDRLDYRDKFSVQGLTSLLIKERNFNDRAEAMKDHAYINLMCHEVFHHPSYRALVRWVNPAMQKKLMDWINFFGMITMILTIPLMYEGLKQWMESFHQPQNSGSAQ